MVADTAKRLLYLALGAMFVQQTFASIGRTLPLVIAPAIIEDLHIDPALVGGYVGAAALALLVQPQRQSRSPISWPCATPSITDTSRMAHS